MTTAPDHITAPLPELKSHATPHTATAWPVPGEPTRWSVSWLPGRALTRDQAITAMTIAQTAVTVRTNGVGSPCPERCSTARVTRDLTDHAHISDTVTDKPRRETRATLVQNGGSPCRPGRLMVDVHEAASDIDPARQLAATTAEMPTDRGPRESPDHNRRS